MRYLGIDYGSKRVGLALSDEGGTMGFPHGIVANTPRLIDDLCAFVAQERVEAVVMGESRTLAGGENSIAAEARALGNSLTERLGIPVFYESEVFTSEEARHLPAGRQGASSVGRKSRAPKTHTPVDDSAAALILTSYLSRTNHG